MTAAAPFRVDTLTDRHGVYEERWMVPPPGEGVMFRVTAQAWVTEQCERCDGTGDADPDWRDVPSQPCPNCVDGRRRMRVIHEWKPVEKRREL
jgi:hypothetical protein